MEPIRRKEDEEERMLKSIFDIGKRTRVKTIQTILRLKILRNEHTTS